MKKFLTVFLLAFVMSTALFAFGACSVDEIYVSERSQHSVKFILGEDIDLSGGILTVVDGGSIEEVALASKDVEISGYDKNTLGEQEITITYKKKTTTIKVEVVARLSFTRYTKAYFVGEEFDKEGQVRIVLNNGKEKDVSLKDPAITITGFNSATEGSCTLSATYTDPATNEVYTGTAPVKIYNVDSSSLVKPRPQYLEYDSHETALKLDACYIELKGNNGALTERISVTEDMVTGFDLSAATINNRENPLVQRLTVKYKDLEFDFNINITFSSVSIIKLWAQELVEIDWEGTEIPTIETDLGEKALEAAVLYSKLNDQEKALITEEEYQLVLKPAVVFGLRRWENNLDSYENTFTVENGTLILSAYDYDRTKEDCANLLNEEDEFRVNTDLLFNIKTEHKDTILHRYTTIGDYLYEVFDPAVFDDMLPLVDYLVEFHDKLSGVPTIWSAADLSQYYNDISATVIHIDDKYTEGYRSFYSVINNWRPDFFDILYTYYLEVSPNESTLHRLQEVQLPGELETLYSSLLSAMNTMQGMGQKTYDVVNIVLGYNNAVEIYNEIQENGSTFHKRLLEEVTLPNLLYVNGQPAAISFKTLLNYVRDYGYNTFMMRSFNSPALNEMWNSYTAIFTLEDSSEFQNTIINMLQTYIKLSPAEQYMFFKMSNYGYGDTGMEFDFTSDSAYTSFAFYVKRFFVFSNNDEAYENLVFRNLMMAIEYYALRYSGMVDDPIGKFMECMEIAIENNAKLTDGANEMLEMCTDIGFEKYEAIYNLIKNETELSLGDWEDEFEELDRALGLVLEAYNNVQQKQQYINIVSYFEYANQIHNNIVKNAPEEVLNYYYHKEYSNVLSASIKCPLEYVFTTCRTYYGAVLSGLTMGIIGEDFAFDVWDVYGESAKLQDFTKGIVSLIEFDNDTTAETVTNLMKQFRSLSANEYSAFLALDKITNNYFGGLKKFADKFVDNANARSAVELLIEAEKAYAIYSSNPEGSTGEQSNYNYFKNAFESAKTAFDVLNDEAKEVFNQYFQLDYEFCLNAYNKAVQDNA